MSDKKGFARLSDLASEVESISEQNPSQPPIQDKGLSGVNHEHTSKKPPHKDSVASARKLQEERSGGFFSGILKILLAIPWQLYLICGGIAFFCYQDEIKDRTINSFQSEVDYYLIRNNNSSIVPSLTSGVLPIDIETRNVDRMFFQIKDSYKPKDSAGVFYVVGFKCSDEVVGSYSDGAYGYQKSCDIYVINVRSHTWSYAGKFKGSEPPRSKKGGGSRTGSHPAEDYLRRAGVI